MLEDDILDALLSVESCRDTVQSLLRCYNSVMPGGTQQKKGPGMFDPAEAFEESLRDLALLTLQIQALKGKLKSTSEAVRSAAFLLLTF